MQSLVLKRPLMPKGNQNARKHGFYSRTLGLDEAREFWDIANLEGVDAELAVFRVKLSSVLQHDPHNRRALREAARMLAKWSSARYGLGRNESNYLKRAFRLALEQHVVPSTRTEGPLQNESIVL